MNEKQERRRSEKISNDRQEATEWIEAVTKSKLTKGFFESLKNGVILCKLINTVKPGTIKIIVQDPKHVMECRANINEFIRGCEVIGVVSIDRVTERDFSDNEKLKDEKQLVQCIFAIARQAQAHGCGMKQLGATYY